MWIADSFILGYSTFPAAYIPPQVRVPPGILVIIGALLFIRNVEKVIFGQVRKKPRVITEGPFSVVRHPLYLGSILIYAGFLITTLSLLAAVVWLAIIWFYYHISLYEEKLLTERFGDEYEDYKERVPMLFPLGGSGR